MRSDNPDTLWSENRTMPAGDPIRQLPQRVALKAPAHVLKSLGRYNFQTQGDCCDRLWSSLKRIVDEHCARIDRIIDQRMRDGDETPELVSKYTNYVGDLFHMALGAFRDEIWSNAMLRPDQEISCTLAETHFHVFVDMLENAKLKIVQDWLEKPKSRAAQHRRKGRNLPYGLDCLFRFGIA